MVPYYAFNPRPQRCARITLAYLRDALMMVAIRFVDAAVNLGVFGAKRAGSLGILGRYLKTGRSTSPSARRGKRGENELRCVTFEFTAL